MIFTLLQGRSIDMNPTSSIKRNLVIYTVGALSIASMGGIVTANGNEAGGLLFILSPIGMMVLLRFFGGDGWQDAGIGLKLKEQWRWYLFSVFAYPITFLIVLTVGVIIGVTKVNADINAALPVFFTGFASQLIPRMIFAMFEEWGWRGYLEPRLVALNVPDLKRHVLVGFIWAIWHFPLILSTSYTEIPYSIFFPIFVLGVIAAAVVYGQVRKISGSVWTAVVMHGVANAVAWSLIETDLITIDNKLLANIAPESILMIVLWMALGGWLLSRRNKAD